MIKIKGAHSYNACIEFILITLNNLVQIIAFEEIPPN